MVLINSTYTTPDVNLYLLCQKSTIRTLHRRMENTQKGYIVPLVLIVLLIGLAGLFLFAGQPAEAPIANEDPVVPTPVTAVPETDPTDTGSTTDNDGSDESSATTTASTTDDIEDSSE